MALGRSWAPELGIGLWNGGAAGCGKHRGFGLSVEAEERRGCGVTWSRVFESDGGAVVIEKTLRTKNFRMTLCRDGPVDKRGTRRMQGVLGWERGL